MVGNYEKAYTRLDFNFSEAGMYKDYINKSFSFYKNETSIFEQFLSSEGKISFIIL